MIRAKLNIVAVREYDFEKKKRKKQIAAKKSITKKKCNTFLPDDDNSLLSWSLQCQTAEVHRPNGLDMQDHYSAHPEYIRSRTVSEG